MDMMQVMEEMDQYFTMDEDLEDMDIADIQEESYSFDSCARQHAARKLRGMEKEKKKSLEKALRSFKDSYRIHFPGSGYLPRETEKSLAKKTMTRLRFQPVPETGMVLMEKDGKTNARYMGRVAMEKDGKVEKRSAFVVRKGNTMSASGKTMLHREKAKACRAEGKREIRDFWKEFACGHIENSNASASFEDAAKETMVMSDAAVSITASNPFWDETMMYQFLLEKGLAEEYLSFYREITRS